MSFQIETGRLILRDVLDEDIPTFCKYFAEPESRDNILSVQADEAYNKNEFAKAIAWAQVSPRPYYILAVTLKIDGTLIGDCNINNAEPESFETNIGWHYGHRFRGNGYATEAARALLDFAFEFVEVNEVFADCFVGNKASIRIMEKIGMRPSALNFSLFNTIRGWSYGENKSTVRHTVSRHEWREQTKRLRRKS